MFGRLRLLSEMKCCSSQCLEKTGAARLLDIFSQSELLRKESTRAFGNWVREILKYGYSVETGMVTLYGRIYCQKALHVLFRMTSQGLTRMIKSTENGTDNSYLPAKRGMSVLIKTDDVYGWLHWYFKLLGEKDPMTNKLVIRCATIGDIFEQYRVDSPPPHVGHTTFYDVCQNVRREMNVSIRKTDMFSRCAKCIMFRRLKVTRATQADRDIVTKLKGLHDGQIGLERGLYRDRRVEAARPNSNIMTIIIDGMDQRKTSCPHFREINKSIQPLQLGVHVTGAIVHGRRKYFHLGWKNLHPGGADSVVTLLLEILATTPGPYPPHLIVYADNTARENKNQCLFQFLALLVSEGIFKTITLCFLPVGHTHNDIDGYFGNVSEKLKGRDAPTLPALAEVITSTFPNSALQNQPVQISMSQYQFGVTEWLKTRALPVSHFSKFHEFKFFKNPAGDVEMTWKRHTRDPDYLPHSICILKAGLDVSKEPPPAMVPIKADCFDLTKLREVQDKIVRAFDNPLVGIHFSEDEKAYWRTWADQVWQEINRVDSSMWYEFFKLLHAKCSAPPEDQAEILDLEAHADRLIGCRRMVNELFDRDEEDPLIYQGQRDFDRSRNLPNVNATLEPGSMIALFLTPTRCDELNINHSFLVYAPLLAEVVSYDSDTAMMTIQWYMSTRNTARQQSEDGATIGWNLAWRPWVEDNTETRVHVNDVVSHGFRLSGTRKLQKHVQQYLQELYLQRLAGEEGYCASCSCVSCKFVVEKVEEMYPGFERPPVEVDEAATVSVAEEPAAPEDDSEEDAEESEY